MYNDTESYGAALRRYCRNVLIAEAALELDLLYKRPEHGCFA